MCGHTCDYSIVDMPSLRSARYIRVLRNIFHKTANSICFRYAQARYDIDPRSRSEHIECVSTYRTRQRISKIRASGSISTRSVLKDTTHVPCSSVFYQFYQYIPPIPPAPAIAAFAAASAAGSFLSATTDSVVSITEAMEEAFWSAERVTFVGSTMPALIMSQ